MIDGVKVAAPSPPVLGSGVAGDGWRGRKKCAAWREAVRRMRVEVKNDVRAKRYRRKGRRAGYWEARDHPLSEKV